MLLSWGSDVVGAPHPLQSYRTSEASVEADQAPRLWSPSCLRVPAARGRLSPLEETHEQAEVEEGIKREKETVPQARPRVEGVEVQIVVVTDARNYCRQQGRGGRSGPGWGQGPWEPPSHRKGHCTLDVEGQGCSGQQYHQRLPREECVQEASNALPCYGFLHI